MRALPLLAATMFVAGCASQPPRPPQAMVPAGDPVNCVQTNRIRSTHVVDDQTVDFRMNDGTVLRNTLPMSCPGLNMAGAFSYRPTGSQLCSVDMITVVHTGGGPRRGASCGLGQFVPVKPEAPTPAARS